jgi:hypothetical protein
MNLFLKISFILFSLILLTGCMVTDEIEFKDKVNYPPSIIDVQPPSGQINYAVKGSTVTFTVTLFDHDKDDFDYYDGRIVILETLNSSYIKKDIFSCKEPQPAGGEDFSDGITVIMTCQATLRTTLDTQNTLQIEVEISDRGYDSGNSLPEDANTVKVLWTYELLEQNSASL